MEENQRSNTETKTLDPSFSSSARVWTHGEGEKEMGFSAHDSIDSMILVSGPRLIPSGTTEMDCRRGEFLLFAPLLSFHFLFEFDFE